MGFISGTSCTQLISSSTSIMSLKFAVFVVLVALASAEEPCREHIRKLKADPSLRMDADACTSRHGKFNLHIDLIHGLVNEHISQSFLYSSMSSHFASDKVNRLGLSKFMAAWPITCGATPSN